MIDALNVFLSDGSRRFNIRLNIFYILHRKIEALCGCGGNHHAPIVQTITKGDLKFPR